MGDIVERLREWRRGVRGLARYRALYQAITPTDALMEEAVDEIERLHKANKRLDRYCLEYGKAYARLEAKLARAEAVIEAARHHAQDQYAMELAEKISTYDKEKDDD